MSRFSRVAKRACMYFAPEVAFVRIVTFRLVELVFEGILHALDELFRSRLTVCV